jgi:hypothetical protein
MHPAPSTAQSIRKDDAFQKWGCLIFILAAALFAGQRFLLFSWLLYTSANGSAPAYQALQFLYGNPPFSIIDILLGFDFPSEGWFYLLQPHNIAVGAAQAVHFAITLGLAYLPFWLFDRARKSPSNRLWLRLAGALVALALPVSLIALSCQFGAPGTVLGQTPEAQVSAISAMRSYSSPDAGISFQYPEFMTIQADTQRERDPGGVIVTMRSISATSTDPVLALMVSIIEDPLRNSMYPALYPPSEDTLRLLAVADVTHLNYPSTERNQAAVEAVDQGAIITTISGYDAAVYRLGLEGMEVGHVHLVGAIVITDTRDVSLYLIGSDEPDVSGSVQPSYVDDLWSRFVASLEIAY